MSTHHYRRLTGPATLDTSLFSVGLDPHPTTHLLRRHGLGADADPPVQQLGRKLVRQLHQAICRRRSRMTAARAGKDGQLRSLADGLQHYAQEDRHRSADPG